MKTSGIVKVWKKMLRLMVTNEPKLSHGLKRNEDDGRLEHANEPSATANSLRTDHFVREGTTQPLPLCSPASAYKCNNTAKAELRQ